MLYIMLNFGAQLVMINKWLTQELSLICTNLEPFSFIVVTSIEGMEQAIGYNMQPLQLIFCTRFDPLYSHLFLK